MYRALYRTWRPRTFDDVAGQKHITDILKYQVEQNKTSHAYLFCGSRGTGKTSCAKILAKAVNCLHPKGGNPCNECEACRAIDLGNATDVIEMDAASNNGVDNVRDLKEEIVFLPADLKYRVYIIDEVHMMSPSAFNALLKTLEEPPGYVLFILATTELHKLPSTIISRCQRYDFRRITTDTIMDRLFTIAEKEGMDLKKDGAHLIARSAQGGMRDAVSMLELCGGMNAPIDETLAANVLGVGNRDTVYQVAEAIENKDYATLYRVIDSIVMSSGNLGVFWQQLGDLFRDMMVFLTVPNPKEYLDVTDTEFEKLSALTKELTVGKLYYRTKLIEDTLPDLQKSGSTRRAAAEVALSRMCDPRTYAVPEALVARIEELEKTVKRLQLSLSSPQPLKTEEAPKPLPKKEEKGKTPPPVPSVKAPAPEPKSPSRALSAWRGVVEEFSRLFPYYATLFVGSRAFDTGDGVLTIQMQDQFLLPGFERDENGKAALLRMAGDAAGTAYGSLKIEKTNLPITDSDDEDKF